MTQTALVAPCGLVVGIPARFDRPREVLGELLTDLLIGPILDCRVARVNAGAKVHQWAGMKMHQWEGQWESWFDFWQGSARVRAEK